MVVTKQMGLLRDMVPKLATVGLVASPLVPMVGSIIRDVQAAAQSVGLKAVIADVNSERDIDNAFQHLVEQQMDGLLVPPGVFFGRLRDRMILLAAQHAIPAIAMIRDYPAQGGLMSYGAVSGDLYRQTGLYVARLLRQARRPAGDAATSSSSLSICRRPGRWAAIPPGLPRSPTGHRVITPSTARVRDPGRRGSGPLAKGSSGRDAGGGYLSSVLGPNCKSPGHIPQGPGEGGFIDGRNVTIEYRYAHNDIDRLPELAADLCVPPPRGCDPAVLGSTAAALAVKAATTTIPVVFTAAGGDPVNL
jgi:putative ABC transport system substrate-binding protein